MSTGQQQASTEQLKNEVRQAVRSLTEFSRTADNYGQFCERVLNDVVRITGAHGALLWEMKQPNSPPALSGFSGQAPDDQARAILSPENENHTRMLMEVIGKKKPVGITSEAYTGPADPDAPVVPVPFLMLFAPVVNRKQECYGTLELVQRGNIGKTAQEGYLRFLSQIAQLFQRWHEHRDLTQLSASADQWSRKVEFIDQVHQSIDTKETAYAIANEARRLLKADRVSVGKWNGRRCKVIAISSQDRFDNRANVVRKLSKVATSSVAADTQFWITGDTDGIAPEVARKINDYLDESNCRTFAVIPLVKRPDDSPNLEQKKRRREKPVKLGALIVEYFDADVTEEQIADDCGLIVNQSQLALHNAKRHNEIFMAPVWKKLGWLQTFLFRDHFAKTMTGLAALTCLVLAMIFWPVELLMNVDGVMHPQIRQNIYAQTSGTVDEILIEENSIVKKGTPLMKLRNVDLEVQINQTDNQLLTLRSQMDGLEYQLSAGGGREDNQPNRVMDAAAQFQMLKEQMASQKKLKTLLEKKKSMLEVNAPLEGSVITRDPQRLKDYPVSPSQRLLTISKLDGPWELEIKIPQHKIGYIDNAIREAEQEAKEGGKPDPLKVTYIVTANPNVTLNGELVRISDRTFPDDQGVPHYRGVVRALDIENLEKLRPGAGLTASVYCGKRSLGFRCFYQLWDYVRTNLIF